MPTNVNQSTANVLVLEKMGIRVDRATGVLGQTASIDVFTVSGGTVMITGMVGTVTTIIQAQANAVKYIAHPATGTDVDLCATADLNGLEVGGMVALPNAVGTALIKSTAGGNSIADVRIIAPSGTIIRQNAAASSTGSVKHTIWYIPIDNGAVVTAN